MKLKNHTFILDVFNEIVKKMPDSYLVLVGDGELIEQVREKVVFLGLKDKVIILSHRNDIPEILRAFDIFLFPSIIEGFPITVAEAQVMNIRCIISDSITSECILSENTIPLSINCSPEKWALTALDNTIKNSNYINIENYNMDNVMIKLEKLYRES